MSNSIQKNSNVYFAQTDHRMHGAEIQNPALDDLTNLCIAELEQLQVMPQVEKSLKQKRAEVGNLENPANNKIRKIDSVQKHIVNHVSGSVTKFTLNKDGNREGKAKYTSHDGTILKYHVKNNTRTGPATRYYTDGDVEELTYRNNIKEGPSTYRYHNGIIGTGTFVNGLLEGKVTKSSLTNGMVIESLYENGVPSGIGKITYHNGDEITINGSFVFLKMLNRPILSGSVEQIEDVYIFTSLDKSVTVTYVDGVRI